MIRLEKEICQFCLGGIKIGQSISECGICNVAIHSRCFKNSSFKLINDCCYCLHCSYQIKRIYNPFRSLIVDCHDSDRQYDTDVMESMTELYHLSDILDSCKYHASISEFNANMSDSHQKPNVNFTALFQNVDGNKSNFDNFAIHIRQIQHEFSIIGLAETNVTP